MKVFYGRKTDGSELRKPRRGTACNRTQLLVFAQVGSRTVGLFPFDHHDVWKRQKNAVNSENDRMFYFSYSYMDLILQAQVVRRTSPPHRHLYTKCISSIASFIFSISSSLKVLVYRFGRKYFYVYISISPQR